MQKNSGAHYSDLWGYKPIATGLVEGLLRYIVARNLRGGVNVWNMLSFAPVPRVADFRSPAQHSQRVLWQLNPLTKSFSLIRARSTRSSPGRYTRARCMVLSRLKSLSLASALSCWSIRRKNG